MGIDIGYHFPDTQCAVIPIAPPALNAIIFSIGNAASPRDLPAEALVGIGIAIGIGIGFYSPIILPTRSQSRVPH